jgi:hypothetical protein
LACANAELAGASAITATNALPTMSAETRGILFFMLPFRKPDQGD